MALRSAAPRALAALALLVYAVVLARSPVLHHDAQCHVRQPGHCDACRVAGPAPLSPSAAPSLPRPEPTGIVAPAPRVTAEIKRPERKAGRAPPASA